MSTGYELSIGEERLPIKVKDLSSAMKENVTNYDILKRHLLEFLKQIVPIDEVPWLHPPILVEVFVG